MNRTISLRGAPLAKRGPSIALVGCGAIAERYYLPALARVGSILRKLVLVDRDRTRAERLGARFGVTAYATDYRSVLTEVDGAIVSVPTHLHYEVAQAFLAAGVSVLCEKPLAETADRGEGLVAQASASSVVLATNYLQRLYPSFAKVKEVLAAGSLGEPLSIAYNVGEEFDWPTVSGFYFNAPLSSRGVLRDRGAHVLDHVCWWLGAKPAVELCQNDSFGGSDAVARVRLRHGRCVVDVLLSWLGRFPCTYKLECEDGAVRGDVYDIGSLFLRMGRGPEKRIRLKSSLRTKVDVGVLVVADFVNAICSGGRPLIPGSDVLDSIRLIDECYAAAVSFPMPWYDLQEALHGWA